MIETKISGQYNDALFTIFDPPAKKNLATEESIPVTVFKCLMSFAESLKLVLTCSTVLVYLS